MQPAILRLVTPAETKDKMTLITNRNSTPPSSPSLQRRRRQQQPQQPQQQSLLNGQHAIPNDQDQQDKSDSNDNQRQPKNRNKNRHAWHPTSTLEQTTRTEISTMEDDTNEHRRRRFDLEDDGTTTTNGQKEQQQVYNASTTTTPAVDATTMTTSESLSTSQSNNNNNKTWWQTERFQKIRDSAGKIVNNTWFQLFIVLLIVINGLMMGIATFDFVDNDPARKSAFEEVDRAFLIVFTIELALQFTHHGWRLFTDGWLVFDFVIVLISWSLDSLQIVRTFRIFRALRLVNRIRVLKDLVSALLSVVPRMSAIICLLLLIFYIFGVMCTVLFGDLFENGQTEQDYFSRLDLTMWTLLVIMTLDWAEIARQVQAVYPLSPIVFVSFVGITSFIAYNLMIAVVCDSVTIIEQQYKEEIAEEEEEFEHVKIERLQKRVLELTQQQQDIQQALRATLSKLGLQEPKYTRSTAAAANKDDDDGGGGSPPERLDSEEWCSINSW